MFGIRPSHSVRSIWLMAPLVVATACEGDGPRVIRGESAALVQYQSCDALQVDLKSMLLADAYARIEQGFNPGPVAEGAADQSTNSNSSRTEGQDFSGTNNQEQGVDEADFVKTDGYGIYTLNGNRLHVFDVAEFGDLAPRSETKIEGYPSQMLLSRDHNRVVVFSQILPYQLPESHPLREAIGVGEATWRTEYVTKLTVLDIGAVAAEPTVVREVYIEGWYQTARLVQSALRMNTYGSALVPELDQIVWGWSSDVESEQERKQLAKTFIDGLELSDMVPRTYERTPSGDFRTLAITEATCRSFARPADSTGRGVSSLVSMDLASSELAFEADHIITNWPTFYASADKVYLADAAQDWWFFWDQPDLKDQTNIHVFDTAEPGRANYLGSGRVNGSAWSQFNFSEFDGYLRVATTENLWSLWWRDEPEEPTTNVFVMKLSDQRLRVQGQLNGLAPGERLFASRFLGERGFLVTFELIDPLFTIDLSNPEQPVVAGELKVPGFSTYLHPISEDALLSVGVGGDDNGTNWRAQVSLFDTSDFTNPRTTDVEELVSEGQWGWSEALYEHKAFQYFKGQLAVPVANYTSGQGPNGDVWWNYTSQLVLLDIEPGVGITRRGAINHSHLFNSDTDSYWYYREIRRSIFMGDYIYAISDRGITVHRLDSLQKVNEAALPGYSPDDQYWWW